MTKNANTGRQQTDQRVTLAEYHPIRVGFAAIMLMEGVPAAETAAKVAEEFGVGLRQAERYTRAAKHVVAGRVEMARADHRKWHRAQLFGLFASAKAALAKASTVREISWSLAECRGCLAQLVTLDKLAYDPATDLDEHDYEDTELAGHVIEILGALADRSPELLADHAALLGKLARAAKKATET